MLNITCEKHHFLVPGQRGIKPNIVRPEMKMYYPKTFTICILLMITGREINAQNVASKNFRPRHKAYHDSLKSMNYDRVLPFLGSRVYKRGFDIPFPLGIMFNSFYGAQGIDITNIKIGFKGPNNSVGPVDMSNLIKFDDVVARGLNLNLRADAYIFPFLNVYAILGYMPHAQTSVKLAEPVQITSNPTQSGWNYGFGIMGAGGVGPVWIQADYNVTWAHMQLLENKVFTQISGIRVGHVFSLNNPQKNISVWIGMMGIFLNNETVGEISLSEVFPGITQDKVDQIKAGYPEWYDGLGPVQKQVVDNIVDKLEEQAGGAKLDDIYVTYSMDKAPHSKWAGLVGAQFQLSKKWQFRVESNLISKGDRYSILASINYRFLGFKKKHPNQINN